MNDAHASPAGVQGECSAMSKSPSRTFQRRVRFQITLIDLMVLVLSAGIILGIVRHTSHAVWATVPAIIGLAMMPLAFWFIFRLTIQLVLLVWPALDSTGPAVPSEATATVAACLWRVAACTALIGFCVEESSLLLLKEKLPEPLVRFIDLRLGLMAVCGLLFMIGLVLGVRTRARRLRPATRATVLQRTLGWMILLVLIVVAATQTACIPYFVLIALEAVAIATRFWEGNGAGSLTRLSLCTLPAAVSLASCLLAGIWLAHDMRCSARPNKPQRTFGRMRCMSRLISVAAPMLCATYLVVQTFPMLNTQLAEGLRMAIGMPELIIVLLGFAGLSAGIAVRAVLDPPASDVLSGEETGATEQRQDFGRRLKQLTGGILTVVAILLLASFALSSLPLPLVEWLPADFYYLASKCLQWVRKTVEDILQQSTFLFAGYAWLLFQWVWLLATDDPVGSSSFDRALQNGVVLRRFLRFWLSLTAILMSALPTLTIAGFVGYHHFLSVHAWLTR